MYVMIPVLKLFTSVRYVRLDNKMYKRKDYVEKKLWKHRRNLNIYFFFLHSIYDIKQIICLIVFIFLFYLINLIPISSSMFFCFVFISSG